MVPPPQTPTPRRFLTAKRATQQTEPTPTPMRFQSTPRFAASSTVGGTQSRGVEGVEDVESGPSQSQTTQASEAASKSGSIAIDSDSPSEDAIDEYTKHDFIEEDDVLDTQSASESASDGDERVSKRRRLSDSSARDQGLRSDAGTINSEALPSEMGHRDDDRQEDSDEEGPIQEPSSESRPAQPVFRPAPRFKPAADDDAEMAEGLPPAFSPQRRGAKYIPGGLASELQGWLSEVKGWDASGNTDSGAIVRLVVGEVRPGERMYLVKGHVRSKGMTPGDEGDEKRYVLAGEGRLTGSGRRAMIENGSIVRVAAPVWDVELEGYTWTVACEWSIE